MANKSARDFHHRCKLAADWLRACWYQYGVDHRRCLYYNIGETSQDVFLSKLQVGLYAPILQEWFEIFPRKQFKIIKLEDFSQHKWHVTNGVFQFLGLTPIDEADFEPKHPNPVWIYNRNRKATRSLPMLPETRALLQRLYTPFNVRLSKLLNDSSFLAYNPTV